MSLLQSLFPWKVTSYSFVSNFRGVKLHLFKFSPSIAFNNSPTHTLWKFAKLFNLLPIYPSPHFILYFNSPPPSHYWLRTEDIGDSQCFNRIKPYIKSGIWFYVNQRSFFYSYLKWFEDFFQSRSKISSKAIVIRNGK